MKRAAILMCTYNGEEHILDQLKSIESQSYKNIELFIFDDGSSDKTIAHIERFRSTSMLPVAVHFGGSRKIKSESIDTRVTRNFLSLLQRVTGNSKFEYYFFCDQDDIWLPSKIDKFIRLAEKHPSDRPFMIHSDLVLVDHNGETFSDSIWDWQKINVERNSLPRLFFENTVTGCAAMINHKLASLIDEAPKWLKHDHYLAIIAATFGNITSLREPTTKYRQHGKNVSGAGPKNGPIFRRLCSVRNLGLLRSRIKKIKRINFEAEYAAKFILDTYGCQLSQNARQICNNLVYYSGCNIFVRAFGLFYGKYLPKSVMRASMIIVFRN